ncbi:MAG: RdgB/HAM1 family non-canonical purine NTP pyrophosphatase [Planctomycetota bacterium]|nr:RdgB/HAM1 family non-canonical purine NTP pyrophosphatase [Planctomycetaceae bacterium]MDQ3332614.1 RdgB/HAM1 family non-canonical purine NTP pyrophosphatase [Planctomycetota bacterium]
MTKIVVATRNRKKLGEIAELLAPYGLKTLCVADFSDVPETLEDGSTFAENATKKAREVAKRLGRWAIGEDSGLCVDALSGRPGLFSARYAGEHATDDLNNAKLQSELAGVPEAQRGAGYVCSVALCDAAGNVRLTEEATCRGVITSEPRGSNGFGYDPYFLIPEYHRTFGELPSIVKRHLSHRARAFARLTPRLATLVRQDAAFV